MTPDTAAAARIVADVTRDEPRGLYLLAVHASLPAAVDAALLHHIRDNFLLDGPPAERLPVTPGSEAGMARLLLSPLFSQVDSDLFEMVPAVRAVLLDELSTLHGGRRLAEVAALLERYTVRTARWADRPELQWAQRVSARVVSDPAAVDEWLARAGTAGNSDLDDRWFVAMRARLDRDRVLGAAATRTREERVGAEVDRRVRRCLAFVPDGGDPPPAFRVLTGGLYLSTARVPDAFPLRRLPAGPPLNARVVSSAGDGAFAAILAVDPGAGAHEADHALELGAAVGPDDPLFLVTVSENRSTVRRAHVTATAPGSFTVTADLPPDAEGAAGRSVVVDDADRLVGLVVSLGEDPDGRPVWTAMDADAIAAWVATRIKSGPIGRAVRTPQDGVLCMRLVKEALRAGLPHRAGRFAELAQAAVGDDDVETVAWVLAARVRVAREVGGDHTSVVNEARLLLGRLGAGSAPGRELARQVLALAGVVVEPPAWLSPLLTVLIGQFDAADTEARDGSGVRAGSVAAVDVVAAMPPTLTADQLAELRSGVSPGGRLLAAAYLEQVPDPAGLLWLAAQVDPAVENRDVAYQAAAALLAAAERLPDRDFDDLDAALNVANRPVLNLGSPVGRLVDDARTTLARRRGRVGGRAPDEFAEVPERYGFVRRIGISLSGRDVVVARDRVTEALVVLRIGPRADGTRSATLARAIGGSANRYVTGPVEWGHTDEIEYEVHEYVAGGSLADLRTRRPPEWTGTEVETVLTGLLGAVEYLHSCGVIHRNISPTSVLVRSEAPLDLVLSGLDHAVRVGDAPLPTGRLQPAYTAPEMASGTGSPAVSPAVDWWSVGIVLFDLLTGWNPFQRPDRAWRHGDEIVRSLAVHEVDLSPVRDRRWRLLLQGLLTREPSARWGAPEVRGWLAGATRGAATRHDPGFLFAGTAYTAPRALADAFRENPSGARALLAGHRAGDPLFLALRDWASLSNLPATRHALTGPPFPDDLLPTVIAALDADARPAP